jgi:hypothetical protein
VNAPLHHIAAGLISAALLVSTSPANARGKLHLFEVSNGDATQSFVIALSDPEKVDMARKIVSGKTTDAAHVNGRIIKSRARYNPKWSFYLSPGESLS